MSQRDTLVARAIVSHEIGCLPSGEGGSAAPLSVFSIVRKYALSWGYFKQPRIECPRADQLIRNELNKAVLDGRLVRAEKNGRWQLYVRPSSYSDEGWDD